METINNLWDKRNICDETRVDEFVELYKSMGYEVKVESFNSDYNDVECNECMLETPEKFKVIFTRRSEYYFDELFDEEF